MTRAASPKLGAYAGLAGIGLLAALVLQLPELVALAAPFALVAVVSLVLSREPQVSASLSLERERALEGDELEAVLTIESETGVERVEMLLRLPTGLAVAEGPNPVALRFAPGERRELSLRLRCDRWGAYVLGDVRVRAHGVLGAFRWEGRIGSAAAPLKVYPREETLLALLRPADTQVYAGNHVSREKGEGIEFADLRPFAGGDRVRRINWRASARRGQLVVNENHPERNADVVLFVDSFADVRGDGEGTLDRTVRAASALAGGYLRQKDRVGFVTFGGRLNWLVPGSGLRQLYRIIDSLLDTEIVLNFVWRDLEVIPRRTLPPKALVVALSPLLDERSSEALLDLRARGFDLAVLEVSPLPFVRAGKGERGELAYRLWRLRREALRARFEAVGVPVGVWDERVPLAGAVEEVRAFRRFARAAHV